MRMSGSRIRTGIQDPGSIVEVSNLTKELIPSRHVSPSTLILSSPEDVGFHYKVDQKL